MVTVKMIQFSYFLIVFSTISAVLCDNNPASRQNCFIAEYSQVSEATLTCDHLVIGNLSVPAGKTLTLNLKGGSTLLFNGTVLFEHLAWVGPLMMITGYNLIVEGLPGSQLNGNGPLYWDGRGGAGSTKPYFMQILARDSSFKNINVLNCPTNCIFVINSDNVVISGWTIDNSIGNPGVAPVGHEGHNTDGFDIEYTTNLVIENCTVYNQDDCIAVNNGHNMVFRNMFCSGCHGLSISVGHKKLPYNTNGRWLTNKDLPDSTVVNVTFENSVVTNSDNGLHLKTKPGPWTGELRDVTYRNLRFTGIRKYGISIQQDYNTPGHPQNNIPIKHLVLENVTGIVQNKKAYPVFINCADGGCLNWNWSGVNITHANDSGRASSCNYIPEGFQCK